MARLPHSQPGELTLFGSGYRLQLLASGSRCQLTITSPVPTVDTIAKPVDSPRSPGDLRQLTAVRCETVTQSPPFSTKPHRWLCEVDVLWVPRDDRGLPARTVQSLDRLSVVGRLAPGQVIHGTLWLPSRLPPATAFRCHYRPASWQSSNARS
jgi:hypothetical protein